MTKSRTTLLTAATAAVLAAWGCVAWAQQGPVGQGINEAGRAVKRGFLTGVVPDEAAKAKALTLTAETVGVAQVVDQLAVAPPSRTAPIVPGVPPTAPTPAPTANPADIPL